MVTQNAMGGYDPEQPGGGDPLSAAVQQMQSQAKAYREQFAEASDQAMRERVWWQAFLVRLATADTTASALVADLSLAEYDRRRMTATKPTFGREG